MRLTTPRGDENRQGPKPLDSLHNGHDPGLKEKAKAEETKAALLSRRKMNRLHARTLKEDEVRESRRLADRLRDCGMLSVKEWKQVEQILRLG